MDDIHPRKSRVWRMISSHHSLFKVRRALFLQLFAGSVAQSFAAAHTYFFRHIFHDWSDQSSREILLQTIRAMKRNYSRIVIMDAVLPSVGASVFSSLLDINMIAVAGIERTDRHWRSLLEGVGLRVSNIEVPPAGDGIIEAVIATNENSPQIY